MEHADGPVDLDIDRWIERSKNTDPIDFLAIPCLELDEPMIAVSGPRIDHDPVWNDATDLEGRLHAAYLTDHPEEAVITARAAVHDRLAKASELLGDRYRLIVRAGHRPVAVQQELVDQVADQYRNDNPSSTATEALEHARIYASDPAIKRPPHCCGAAVDLELFDNDLDQRVDFGSTMNEDSEISYLHSSLVLPKQHANRMLLLRAMLGAGFASYWGEWWHYSYGDETWAWFYDEPASRYGLVT